MFPPADSRRVFGLFGVCFDEGLGLEKLCRCFAPGRLLNAKSFLIRFRLIYTTGSDSFTLGQQRGPHHYSAASHEHSGPHPMPGPSTHTSPQQSTDTWLAVRLFVNTLTLVHPPTNAHIVHPQPCTHHRPIPSAENHLRRQSWSPIPSFAVKHKLSSIQASRSHDRLIYIS